MILDLRKQEFTRRTKIEFSGAMVMNVLVALKGWVSLEDAKPGGHLLARVRVLQLTLQ